MAKTMIYFGSICFVVRRNDDDSEPETLYRKTISETSEHEPISAIFDTDKEIDYDALPNFIEMWQGEEQDREYLKTLLEEKSEGFFKDQ